MDIVVNPSEAPNPGILAWPKGEARCALGRSGVSADKREGDGATPAGALPLRYLLYRSDRETQPLTRLSVRALQPEDGWCDDPSLPEYNRFVRRPFAGRHETLWREDGLYDFAVVLGWNDAPPVPSRGSAIFLHVAGENYAPTEGCVALARRDLLRLLADCGPGDRLIVNLVSR
ncbi:MAG: L,D-transpeptidase family protein [Rhodospirillales bacterium]|nr:L,D-transpeptidase family protein [Rhodospirillales bacterium]